MKSQRRHELREPIVVVWITSVVTGAKRYRVVVAVMVMAAVLAYVSSMFFSGNISSSASDRATGVERTPEIAPTESAQKADSNYLIAAGILGISVLVLSVVVLVSRNRKLKPAVFLSYRRQDSSDVTGRIYDRLVATFGKKNVFKDVDSIPLGVDFRRHLNSKIDECHVFLAIIGDQWLAADHEGKRRLDEPRDFVRMEIEAALKRQIPIIPILVRDAKMPVANELPQSLQNVVFRNGISVRPDPDFHRDVDRLMVAIREIGSRTDG